VYRVGFPYLGEEFAVNARLPGPGQRWFRHGAVVAGYACLAALAIVLGPADGRGLAGAVAAAAPVVLFLAWRVATRCMARIFVLPSWGFETIEAPGLRAALLSAGLRRVIVVTSSSDAVKRTAWALRSGRTGIIGLSAHLKDPEGATPDRTLFLTAHEAAHVVRDDTMTGTLLSVGRLCLLLVVALTAPASLWLLLPLVILPVAVSWHAELACDRMAVEAAGPVPARADADHYSEALERARSRPLPRRVIWWTWDKFTYPPWRMRRSAIAAFIAKQEQASPRARLASWTATGSGAAAARDQYAARLPVRERVLGPDHPDTLTTRHSLAYWTGQAGDPAAARDQFTALLPIRERVLGPEHPLTSTTRHNLAYWTGQAATAKPQHLPPQMTQLWARSDPPRTRPPVVHIGGYFACPGSRHSAERDR
jgi:Tetratricopeptide repeat